MRQVAAKGLAALLSHPISCAYALIDLKNEKHQVFEADTCELLSDVLSRVVIMMMRDHFKDTEDITVVAPVRKEGMLLIEALSRHLPQEMQMLIDNTPQLLSVCQGDW